MMYPVDFEYHRADSIDDAVALLHDHRDADTLLLAGAHGLVPRLKAREVTPDVVVDIGRIQALEGIESTADGLRIGALTRYADVVDADVAWERAPVVAEAAAAIGDPQVRNMGTVGGNVAQAHPASDLPAAFLAMDATMVARRHDGERRIEAGEFFDGAFSTTLARDELLTHVEVEETRPGAVGAYAKRARQALGYAVVGVAVSFGVEDDAIVSPTVAVNGALERPVRLPDVEDALADGTVSADALATAAERAGAEIPVENLVSDLDASAPFRRQLLRVYTRKALDAAAARAGFVTAEEPTAQ